MDAADEEGRRDPRFRRHPDRQQADAECAERRRSHLLIANSGDSRFTTDASGKIIFTAGDADRSVLGQLVIRSGDRDRVRSRRAAVSRGPQSIDFSIAWIWAHMQALRTEWQTWHTTGVPPHAIREVMLTMICTTASPACSRRSSRMPSGLRSSVARERSSGSVTRNAAGVVDGHSASTAASCCVAT